MGVQIADRTPSTTGRKRILVVEPIADEGLDILRADHEVEVKLGMPRDEFLRILPEYDALLVRSQVQADAEAIADRARAMEMEVLGHDPYVTEDAAAPHGVKLLPMDELIRRSDAITVHVPLTRSTRNLIGEAEIASMKPGAYLVNVARGGVIEE